MTRAAAWACVAAALIGMAACAWWETPEKRIRRTLDEIAERLSHEAALDPLAAAAAAAGLRDYLAEDVEIDAGPPIAPLHGREAVVAAATRLLLSSPLLEVEFVDVHVEDPASDSSGRPTRASVACSVTVRGNDRSAGRLREARELNLTMRLAGDRWVVERAQSVNVLEPVS